MTLRARLAQLAREPLAHFLLAGAAIFALFGNQADPAERRIVIDGPRIERLAGQFAQSFRRLPTDAELDALIREDVKDEVYYREGLRLGLDRDDEVVRRRMRNKLESIETTADDIAAPDDRTLQRWLDAHPERFAAEARYSFEQRYLGASSDAARRSLATLRAGGDFAGAPIPLPARYESASTQEIVDAFGPGFASALDRAQPGQWSGPVRSGLGFHLVRVTARSAASAPRLADIRQEVENDWRADQARRRTADAYAAMLARYDVVIEMPR